MSIYARNSDLGRFIISESVPYNAVWEAIERFAASCRCKIDFDDDNLTDDDIELDEIYFKFAVNVMIVEDIVSFDAIIDGKFSAHKKHRHDYDYISGSQWFRLACEMIIEDKLTSFTVKKVSIYSKEEKRKSEFAATSNFVPIISKDEFDIEAERILRKWYSQALSEPIPVPIEAIAEKMGLKIIDTVKLSHDLSAFGQICFAEGFVKVYDEEKNNFVNFKVERGTIFIDPDTFYLRNLGCVNYTIAHEVVHWERHRVYATIKSILTKNQTVAHRCPAVPKNKNLKEAMTDAEDWMEWQANGIAPKILMPKAMTEIKIWELLKNYGYEASNPERGEILKAVITELSEYYGVSKQAAKIRMIELGWPEAKEVYNYDSDCTFLSNEITFADIYAEYQNNEDFHILFDMGLFRNVEGYFVIDTDKYRTQTEYGEYVLTDYARENLADCSLVFAYNIVEFAEFNRTDGVLYREKQRREARPPQYIFAPKYNQAVIDKALEQVGTLQKEIDELKGYFSETASQTIKRLMESRKWKSSTFSTKTGLNQGLFRKITTVRDKRLELPMVVSICVGLCLPQEISLALIEQAGHKLRNNCIEEIVYKRIISGVLPNDIPAINAVIDELNVKYPDEKIRKLGSGTYDGQATGEE